MVNMSYCRFHNTLQDLKSCESVLEEMVDGDPKKLSDEELRAAQDLVSTCLAIVLMLAERGNVYFEPDMDLSALVKELNDAAE